MSYRGIRSAWSSAFTPEIHAHLTSSSSSACAPYPSELRVARTRRQLILLFHLGNLVALNRFALGVDVNLVKPRRVQAEYLRFDFRRQLLVAEFLGDLVADLESPKPLNLRLRAAAPDRVRAPDQMIFTAGKIQYLPEKVHRRLISAAVSARQNVPCAAHLEVDILQVVALHDVDQFRAPRYVLRTGRRAFAPTPAGGRGVATRVIDDEIEIRKVLCDFLDVLRMTVFLIEQTERQSFVNAHSLDAELAASLPKRISDFFIVEPERSVADYRAGIHLPRIDLERLD